MSLDVLDNHRSRIMTKSLYSLLGQDLKLMEVRLSLATLLSAKINIGTYLEFKGNELNNYVHICNAKMKFGFFKIFLVFTTNFLYF